MASVVVVVELALAAALAEPAAAEAAEPRVAYPFAGKVDRWPPTGPARLRRVRAGRTTITVA